MNMSLPPKLAILVALIFGLLITGLLLYRPVKVRYYTSRLRTEDMNVRQDAARKLLNMNEKEPVFDCYTELYASDDVKKRVEVVDELCGYGDRGKAVMKEIFKNWASGPTQQVKIPAGTLTHMNGSKIEIQSLWVDKYEVTNEKYWVFSRCTGHIRKFPKYTRNEERIITLDEFPFPIVSFSSQDNMLYARFLGMRLPTLHEWLYAARAGSTGKYCFGDDRSFLGEYAWYKGNSLGQPHAVGQKKPNRWGLFDVHGNLRELYCGGCYDAEASSCTFYVRGTSTYSQNGFRCVRDVK
ncbi:MAG: formylglycine-generating enzyme family protein [Planctomycetota bacterium]|jgi:hypothetical protein